MLEVCGLVKRFGGVRAGLVWASYRSLNNGLGLEFIDEPDWKSQTLDLGAG